MIVGGEKVDRTACEKTFAAMEKEGVDGLIVGEQVELLAYRELIADLAARFRVPAIYPFREFVEVGGLMAYGVDVADTDASRCADDRSNVRGRKTERHSALPADQIRTRAQSKSSKIAWTGIPSDIVDGCRRGDRIRRA